MDWFGRVQAASQTATEAADLPLAPILATAREALSGYSILYSDGTVARILGDDLRANIAKLESGAASLGMERATLGALLARAACAPGGAHEDAGVWGALWVSRTLAFVAELLRALGADHALSLSSAGRQTYKAVLAPYHAPIFGWLVGFIVGWAPTRAWVLANKLGGADNALASAACARAAAALAPLAAAMRAALVQAGANFPDRVSSLPFGV